ncbi:hypothetical protein B0T14DRAFT_51198 [Immersiella caudata]|uniref:Uncharacterized protein n=1 Tax=Immersiella caudata TaxID=314043 RepID=A0AA39XG69_9PEZI|nr:hypothetical protein B0T14DRAFT_51198 [Immersiella caudata]
MAAKIIRRSQSFFIEQVDVFKERRRVRAKSLGQVDDPSVDRKCWKILLTDGRGITARQLATALQLKGHIVHVVCPSEPAPPPPFGVGRYLSIPKGRVHYVTVNEPSIWVEDILKIPRDFKIHTVIPVHDKIHLISANTETFLDQGLRMAVPPTRHLRYLVNEPAICKTLDLLKVNQPAYRIVSSKRQLLSFFNDYGDWEVSEQSEEGVQGSAASDSRGKLVFCWARDCRQVPLQYQRWWHPPGETAGRLPDHGTPGTRTLER